MNMDNVAVIVPLGGLALGAIGIVASAVGKAQKDRLDAEQRMAMVARGVPIAEIDGLLRPAGEEREALVKDPIRALGNTRRAAVVLISVGMALGSFFAALWLIQHEIGFLIAGAAGLIPAVIGIGFLVDYTMQIRDMGRFGLEVGAEVRRGKGDWRE